MKRRFRLRRKHYYEIASFFLTLTGTFVVLGVLMREPLILALAGFLSIPFFIFLRIIIKRYGFW